MWVLTCRVKVAGAINANVCLIQQTNIVPEYIVIHFNKFLAFKLSIKLTWKEVKFLKFLMKNLP